MLKNDLFVVWIFFFKWHHLTIVQWWLKPWLIHWEICFSYRSETNFKPPPPRLYCIQQPMTKHLHINQSHFIYIDIFPVLKQKIPSKTRIRIRIVQKQPATFDFFHWVNTSWLQMQHWTDGRFNGIISPLQFFLPSGLELFKRASMRKVKTATGCSKI